MTAKSKKTSKSKKVTVKKPVKKDIKNNSKVNVKAKAKAKSVAKPEKEVKAPMKLVAKPAVKVAIKEIAKPVVKPMAKQSGKHYGKHSGKFNVKPNFIQTTAIAEKQTPKEVGATKEKFRTGVKVVYPSHGVGEIKGIETHLVAGTELKTYVIEFEREKMILRIPSARAEKSGLRPLSSDDELKVVRNTLLEKPRSSRGMWSRRAKEYETKINSGNIVAVAEVVRDLHKNVDDPERSYSERVIYENALERLSREVSAIKKMDIPDASGYLVKTINDNNPYFIKKAAAKKAAEESDDDESMAA